MFDILSCAKCVASDLLHLSRDGLLVIVLWAALLGGITIATGNCV